MKEKQLNICGHDVKMTYCAATENIFELIAEKSINIFLLTSEKDEDGKTIIKPATATIGDYLSLAVAGIIAPYARIKADTPVTSDEILYESTPEERNLLITSIIELRAEWYGVPKVVEDALHEEAEKMKREAEQDSENQEKNG